MDLPLRIFQPLADNVAELYEGTARILIVSHNGTIVAATGSPELSGQSLEVFHAKHDQENDSHSEAESAEGEHAEATHLDEILQTIRKGEEHIEFVENNLEVFMPVRTGHTQTPWSVNVIIPMEKITTVADEQRRQAYYDVWRMLGISAFCTLIALAVTWVMMGSTIKPILQAVGVAEQLMASTAEQLAAQAEQLQHTIAFFRLDASHQDSDDDSNSPGTFQNTPQGENVNDHTTL